MADQIALLEQNINTLNEAILKLNEPVGKKKINWSKVLLTPRQAAKKILYVSAPIINDANGKQIPTDEKSIHIIVYGKYLLDGNGKLVDNEIKFPECVDHDRGMSDSHPMFKDKIKNMYKDVVNAFRILEIKKVALKEAFSLAGKQIVAGILAAASSLTILPFGAGLPSAIPALQSIVAAINTLMISVLEIIPFLGPLVNLPLIIGAELLDGIIAVVNGFLILLIGIIKLLTGLKKTVVPIIKLIP